MFFFLLIPPITAQSTNPKSQIDKVCISGSMSSSIDGTYEYFSWDPDTNGSIYYNLNKNQYLYPWIYSPTNKDYLISSDPFNSESSSYCHVPSSKNIFNVDECFNTYDGQWVSYHNQSKQWYIERDVRLVNCNDICVYHSDNTQLNGIYKWLSFDKIQGRSIYHCQQCILSDHPYLNVYLYGYYINNTPHWIIGTDYTQSDALSSCSLNNNHIDSNYIFNLDDCDEWSTQINHVFIDDINMMAEKCTEIVDIAPTKYPTMDPTMEPIEPSINNGIMTTINDKTNDIMISEDTLQFIIINIITVLTFICCIICCIILFKYRRNKKTKLDDTQNDNDNNVEFEEEEIPNINKKKLTPPGYGGFGGKSISSKGYMNINHNNYYYDEGVKKQITIQFDDEDSNDNILVNDGINDNVLNETLNDVLKMQSIDNIKEIELKYNSFDGESDSDDMYDENNKMTEKITLTLNDNQINIINNIDLSDSDEMYQNPNDFQTLTASICNI